MPEIYRTADASSTAAQNRMLNATIIQLVAIAIATGFSTAKWNKSGTDLDLAAVAAGIAFGVAAVFRASTARSKPERTWYDGRAVAESAKTLAWRYAVGGSPFNIELGARDADAALVSRLRALPEQLKDLRVAPSTELGAQITPSMRSLRQASLESRRAAYAEGRVRDQQRWYARKARWNRRRADQWNRFLLTVEIFAATAAVLEATTDIQVDLLPAVGAIVAGATAWLQTKQHESLATAYTVASLELGSIAELLENVDKEEEWANFIDEAEGAISREHTMWRASRTRPEPPATGRQE